MTFDQIEWSTDSTLPVCEDEAIHYFNFQFAGGYAINERPPFFHESSSTSSTVSTVDMVDEGIYTINVWQDTYLPS